ncbi:MAG: AbrB/MazE/SpoVT family DNA-binding domain-containing protein [Thermoanaerobaculia bacterium]
MAKSTITSKFQTTVPREIRNRIGLSPGDELNWEVLDGYIRVVPASTAFLELRGSIRVGRGSTVEDVRRWRARWGTEPD